jgi:hypothetical protein
VCPTRLQVLSHKDEIIVCTACLFLNIECQVTFATLCIREVTGLQLVPWQQGVPKCFASCVGRDSSVGIATRYRLHGLCIESRWGRDFQHSSRPALGHTQPHVQWVPSHSRGQLTMSLNKSLKICLCHDGDCEGYCLLRMTPCSLIEIYQILTGTCFVYLHGSRWTQHLAAVVGKFLPV